MVTMNGKVCIGIIFLAVVFSCQSEQRPTGVLSQEEFSRYLVDIYLAESRLMTTTLPKDSAVKLFVPFEERLLRERGLSDSTVKKTYQYYLAHPQELELIYDAVIDTLNLRQQKVSRSTQGQ